MVDIVKGGGIGVRGHRECIRRGYGSKEMGFPQEVYFMGSYTQ